MTNEPRSPTPGFSILRDPIHCLAFGFGTGLAPVAPGTFGSLPGLLLAALVLPLGLAWKLLLLAALIGIGIVVCGISARRIGVHDHSGIVWDEITGMYATLLVVPPHMGWWIAAFLLFRLFDIWKPWPIRDLDHRMTGGAGIMLDDLLAALYAAGLLALGGWFVS